uniref:Thioesterase domain-containing protein n=1 Tax=Mycena chlorophos TaxID=658473 RepID=A0ABQ0LEY9_MYCCL|nr:predicted protein [Mycena chlorophos]
MLATSLRVARSAPLRLRVRPPSSSSPCLARTYATSGVASGRSLGTLATLSLAAGVSLSAYTLGALYPPSLISLLYPRPAPPPPPDASSPESIAYTAQKEQELQSLPALEAHRKREDRDDWYEVRPHAALPEELRANKLTSGALRGPGKLALLPLARVKRDESEAVIFMHLGRGLCGHDGIIHGGLLATLLDEALGRNAIVNLPSKVGVTATLSIRYRAPTRADQFVVIRTALTSQSGRKALVKGTVEALDGTVLVEADAVFVQPRYARLLNTDAVRKSMGEPPSVSGRGAAEPVPVPVLIAEGEGKVK